MQITNLVYVFNTHGQVLLCAKVKTNSGFTVSLGKRNAPGGKLDEWETVTQGAMRELEEEVGVIVNESQLIPVGTITFLFESKKERDQLCYIYKVINYQGGFEAKEGMKPQWFDTDKLPYDTMRSTDKVRINRMVEGDNIEYVFYMKDDWGYSSYEQVK